MLEIRLKKTWDDITVGEYVELMSLEKSEYDELIDKGIAMVDIIYHIDSNTIPYADFITLIKSLDFFDKKPPKIKAKTKYKLNGKIYELDLNYNTLTTSQYIDLVNYKKDQDYTGMLSAVLFPEGHKYMDGYDIEEVKDDIENHLTVPEAMGILDFFGMASTEFNKHILNYLKHKLMRMKRIPREAKIQITRDLRQLCNLMESSLMY